MRRLLLLVLGMLGYVYAAQAQGYMLSGQIVDGGNKPVKNAGIQAVNNDKLVFGNTNDAGLYFTGELPVGTYEVIIVADSVTYISKVSIAVGDPKKRFYNFKIQDKKASLSKSDKDPFMETALNKLRNAPDDKINGQRQDIIKMRRR